MNFLNMRKPKDISKLLNTKIGRLTIKEDLGIEKNCRWVLVVCDCGTVKKLRLTCIESGHTRSCGCLNVDRINTHGLRQHPLYGVWGSMIQRCYNENNPHYKNYGAIGVTVCDEWRNSFEIFFEWGIGSGWKPGLHLDKDLLKPIDSPPIYGPGYCLWVTRKINQRNRRNNRYVEHNGQTKCLKEWAEEFGIKASALRSRLDRGWSIERAFKNENFKHNPKREAA
jgi:hypothetical protein